MNTPIYSRLLEHKTLDYSPFHTPGHKNNFFKENLFELDFTELPDTDALYEADGIILQTEKNLAKLFSAKRSLISSGGCTLAIQTMLKLACQRGKKILFARNIHSTYSEMDSAEIRKSAFYRGNFSRRCRKGIYERQRNFCPLRHFTELLR